MNVYAIMLYMEVKRINLSGLSELLAQIIITFQCVIVILTKPPTGENSLAYISYYGHGDFYSQAFTNKRQALM